MDPSKEDHHRLACDDDPADLVVGDALHPVGVAGAPSGHPDEEARALTGPRVPCCAEVAGAHVREVDRAWGDGGSGAAAAAGVTALLLTPGLPAPADETTPPPADRVALGAAAAEAVVLAAGASVVVELLPRKQTK